MLIHLYSLKSFSGYRVGLSSIIQARVGHTLVLSDSSLCTCVSCVGFVLSVLKIFLFSNFIRFRVVDMLTRDRYFIVAPCFF